MHTPLSLDQSSFGSNNLNTRSQVRLKAKLSIPCLHQIQTSARGKTVPFTCLFWLQSESSRLSWMWQPDEANGKKATQKCGFGSVCCGCTTPDPPTVQSNLLNSSAFVSCPVQTGSLQPSPLRPPPLLPWDQRGTCGLDLGCLAVVSEERQRQMEGSWYLIRARHSPWHVVKGDTGPEGKGES